MKAGAIFGLTKGFFIQIDGKTKLERMRDGREVWVGAERVTDVTTHPAFREAAKTVAALYDWKSDPARHELLTFEEGGERFAISWMPPPVCSRAWRSCSQSTVLA